LNPIEGEEEREPEVPKLAASAKKTRTRRKKAERQAEIADATLRLMAEHGLSEATNTRIAEAIGVSEPALYAHFDSRLDILIAAMDVLAERMAKWLRLSSNPNILERLREIGEGHATFMAGEVEGFVLPTFEFIASPPRLGLNLRFGERQLEIVRAIASLIEQGKIQGSIRNDLDAELGAWQLVTFAWAEDIARLAGLDQFVSKGNSTRILELFLKDWAPRALEPPAENGGTDSPGTSSPY